MKDELVSIIVPVYNVENYMDECIISLVNQTYKNIEILLINDGSTDNSWEKCQEWHDKDERIRIFTKDNEGLGPTRNFGVKNAKGKWIAFADSDDWVEKNYIEKLYEAVCSSGAEIAMCNYVQSDMKNGSFKRTNYFHSLGIERDEKQIMTENVVVASWNQLIDKKLFERYYLEQPNCKSQGFAIGLIRTLSAQKCVFVRDPLYYYRKGRPGALTTGSESKREDTVMIALPWLINGLKKNELYDIHSDLVKRHVAYVLSYYLFGGWMSMSLPEYCKLKNTYSIAMTQNMDYLHKEIAHLGSWNLAIAMRKQVYLQDMEYAFHFSSLISIMSELNIDIAITHKSMYREKMITRDITSGIWKVFDKKKPDWFVFDLLEERNNIMKIGNGFITESDALKECGMQFDDVEIIKSGSEEWFGLWKQSCDAFMTKMQDYLALDKVIMIRNYLTEAYGTAYEQTVYDDIQTIKSENEVISHCYDYIKENYPEIKVVDVSDDEYYITDINYEYGVYPWYLNTLINEKIADCVRQIIDKK